MATVAQIAANRLNAQKSTGPRSVDGKLASSMNALKHGIDAASVLIPGEDPALYERIAADYRSQIDLPGRDPHRLRLAAPPPQARPCRPLPPAARRRSHSRSRRRHR